MTRGALALSVAMLALAAAPHARAAPRVIQDAPYAPPMVVLPGGTFIMGSSDAETTREGRAPAEAAFEHPERQMTITPFAIGRADVTVGEFDRFVKATNRTSVFDGCMVDKHGTWGVDPKASYLDPGFAQTSASPVVCVTWDDARAYAAWLTRQTGHPYRLVREDEWEYAARAGTTTARWWGDSQAGLCAHANGADRSFDRAYPGDAKANLSCDDGYAGSNPPGAFPPNPSGLYDMLGDVWQWTADCFADTYGAQDAKAASEPCVRRSIRGGSWHNYPNVLRAASRFWLKPEMRSSSLGFRVARDL
jgi:sulfatase modifying factor 1